MLLQRNTKVVIILQSRNFIKCLTTFPFNCLNVVSANILVFLGKLMPLGGQLTLNSVNTLTIKSFPWRPYKQIKIRVLQCWINVGAMSEQINGISEYYCCAQLSWLIWYYLIHQIAYYLVPLIFIGFVPFFVFNFIVCALTLLITHHPIPQVPFECPSVLSTSDVRVPECLNCLGSRSFLVSQLVNQPVSQLVYNAGSVSQYLL